MEAGMGSDLSMALGLEQKSHLLCCCVALRVAAATAASSSSIGTADRAASYAALYATETTPCL